MLQYWYKYIETTVISLKQENNNIFAAKMSTDKLHNI